jgi:hypothetical protein
MADDNRRQMLLLLKDGEKTPTEIAKSFEPKNAKEADGERRSTS